MTLRTMYFEDDHTADRPDPATLFNVARAVGGVASTTGITPTIHSPSPAFAAGTYRIRVERVVGVSDVSIKLYFDGVLKMTSVDTNAARITAAGGVLFTIAESTTATGITQRWLQGGSDLCVRRADRREPSLATRSAGAR